MWHHGMPNVAGIKRTSGSFTGAGLLAHSKRTVSQQGRADRRRTMRVAMYARVSTQRQAQTQTIEQQLSRLQAHCQAQGWQWQEQQVFRDDGYSGAVLKRPGLDR